MATRVCVKWLLAYVKLLSMCSPMCRVVSLQVSPVNDLFLSCSLDKTVRLWDLRSSNCQGIMHLNGRPVAGFDPEGLIFGAGIDSRVVKLYDLKSFDKVHTWLCICNCTFP